jgi:uncharacterized protein (DUF488 family)
MPETQVKEGGSAAGILVFTIGHSDHTLDAFLALLKQHGIEAVADVRSSPYSRHVPHFNKDSISAFLKSHGIDYVFLGRELGARRAERSCYVDGRAEYERIAELALFQEGIRRICRGSETLRIALMCTEKDPLFCHRCLLVSRVLAQAGKEVMHIHADGRLESQVEVEERMIRKAGVEPDLFAGGSNRETLVAKAYREQGHRLAVREESGEYEVVHDRVHEEEC